MVALPENSYDTQAEPSKFEQLPAGTYTAKVIEAEVEEISQNDDKGRCLKLTWQVTGGEHDGRLFWQRLSMWAQNFKSKKPGKSDQQVTEEAINIANQQFAAVREATVGLGKVVRDTDELLGIPCSVTYGPQKSDPRYGEVKSVKPLGGAASGGARAAPGPSRSAPPANGGGNDLPWKKSA